MRPDLPGRPERRATEAPRGSPGLAAGWETQDALDSRVMQDCAERLDSRAKREVAVSQGRPASPDTPDSRDRPEIKDFKDSRVSPDTLDSLDHLELLDVTERRVQPV